MKTYTKEIIRGYVECAIWLLDEQDTAEKDFCFEDLSYSAIRRAVKDCRDFMAIADDDILSVSNGLQEIGHDFWLTRNGHGAGFWDGDYEEPHAANLTAISEKLGECYAYVGDDDKIYMESC